MVNSDVWAGCACVVVDVLLWAKHRCRVSTGMLRQQVLKWIAVVVEYMLGLWHCNAAIH